MYVRRMKAGGHTTSDVGRAVSARHRERRIITGIFLMLVAYVGLGFWTSYFGAGLIRAPLPGPLVHVHALLFVGWIALFATQLLLIRTRRVPLHRTIGTLMSGWAVTMVVSGAATSIAAFRRPGSGVDAGVLAGDLVELAGFAILLSAGFLRRRDAGDHKRLMILACAVLVAPAIIRWPFDLIQRGPPILATLFYLLPPILLAVHDWMAERRIRGATLIGLAVFLAVPLSFVALPAWPIWTGFTDRLRDG